MSNTIIASGQGGVAAGSIVGATINTGNKPSKRTYEQVYREFHEALARAEGAASKMKECNTEKKPYPPFFIYPDTAYRIVANLASELADLAISQGRQ